MVSKNNPPPSLFSFIFFGAMTLSFFAVVLSHFVEALLTTVHVVFRAKPLPSCPCSPSLPFSLPLCHLLCLLTQEWMVFDLMHTTFPFVYITCCIVSVKLACLPLEPLSCRVCVSRLRTIWQVVRQACLVWKVSSLWQTDLPCSFLSLSFIVPSPFWSWLHGGCLITLAWNNAIPVD